MVVRVHMSPNVKISPRRGAWGNRVCPYPRGRGPEARAPKAPAPGRVWEGVALPRRTFFHPVGVRRKPHGRPGARAACPRRSDGDATPSLAGAWVTPGVNSYPWLHSLHMPALCYNGTRASNTCSHRSLRLFMRLQCGSSDSVLWKTHVLPISRKSSTSFNCKHFRGDPWRGGEHEHP